MEECRFSSGLRSSPRRRVMGKVRSSTHLRPQCHHIRPHGRRLWTPFTINPICRAEVLQATFQALRAGLRVTVCSGIREYRLWNTGNSATVLRDLKNFICVLDVRNLLPSNRTELEARVGSEIDSERCGPEDSYVAVRNPDPTCSLWIFVRDNLTPY